MKTLCISQSKFKKIIGYGLFGASLFGVILFMTANMIEEAKLQPVNIGDRTFYEVHSVLNDQLFYVSSIDEKDLREDFHFIGIGCKFLFILHLTGLGVWIYNKQQRFKFSWCEKE